MNTPKKSQYVLEDLKVSLRQKLAVLWMCFMLLFIYVDYLHLYMPGKVVDILKGRVFEFNITPGFLMVALVSMVIPTLMIFLSMALPSKVNRLVNIIIALVYIPYMLFNLVGEAWIHMVFGAVVEVVLLCLIIRYAWKWPRTQVLNTAANYERTD